jgi:mannose-6-phosphate isomerase-like protein (cupin superfamily)
MTRPVNLAEKLAQISTHWDPHVVADYNNNDIMVVKFQGEFPFHLHEDTDDFFLVLKGEMVMDIEDTSHVVKAGEVFVVPKGVPNTGNPATAAPKPRL